MVTLQSGGVTEIFTLHRMMELDFMQLFWKALMHNFLTMYNTRGSKVDGLAEKSTSLQPNEMLKVSSVQHVP